MPSRKLDRENINSTSASSGIRGQLSAPSKAEKTKGWRLIQLSDVRDELQVLLPPRPAAIYANLLKVEAYTLSRNDSEHLKKVRYLKEVMIRKCEKIVEDIVATSNIGNTSTGALLFEAPLEFRVKRLEQWWEQWERSGKHRTKFATAIRGRTQASRPLAEQTKVLTVAGTSNGVGTHPSQSKPGALDQKHAATKRTNDRARYEGAQYDVADEYVMVSHTSASLPAEQSPMDKRKALAPIMVASSSHIKSPQPSPQSNAPQTPVSPSNTASTLMNHIQVLNAHSPHAQIYQNLPSRPPLLHSPPHQPTPHVANQSLAVPTHGSQLGSNSSIPISGSIRHDPSNSRSPVYSANSARDARLATGHGTYPMESSNSPTKASGDPSYLKNQFHATYMATPSDLSSSPSAVSPQPRVNAYGQVHATAAQNGLHSGLQPARPMTRKPHTVSYSANSVSTPIADREHRRRATVDCDDTERSVPRPKGYMYASVTPQLDAHQHDAYAQYTQHQNGTVGHSPSMMHRLTRALKHGVQVMGSSSSASSSPRDYGRGAALAGRSPSGSPQSQGSYGDSSLNGSHHQQPPKGSANLLAPVPVAQALSSPGSNASSGDANHSPQYPTRGRTKLLKRPSNQQMRPKTPDRDTQAARGRQPHPDDYANGHTSYAPRNPPGTPYRRDKVILDDDAYDPLAPNRRDSRYTSGGSSVSEPVIPDPALIREVDAKKTKAERVKRRLVPLRSSSEESSARRRDVESEMSDFTDVEYDDDDDGGFYKRPTRSRDGYGSGYASDADGMRPRSLSRPPSRPPSRGILKRSSSVCSQRSTKSVRLEIPKDRRALEEVRDAEEKVEHADKQLKELLRRSDKSGHVGEDVMNATAELTEARHQLVEKEEAYDAILDKNRRQKSDRNEPTLEPRYV